MGAICSSTERKKSDVIDKKLALDAEKFKQEVKLLLLGAGESGKSTIVRQMKIIHMNGYPPKEAILFKPVVFNNIVLNISLFQDGLDLMGLKWKLRENEKAALELQMEFGRHKVQNEDRRLSSLNEQITLNEKHASILKKLWADPIVADAMHRRSEFYLPDSAHYYFQNIERICLPGYTPTAEDILRVRKKTTGIVDTRFRMEKIKVHMFDVGGQRSERRKWIHCFEGVTMVIFVTSLSEYDQTLLEDARINRMVESVSLFDSVVNSRWFSRASMVVLLNKIDIFKEKLGIIPLRRYYPEFDAGEDPSLACKFIMSKFSVVNRAKLKIYPHVTCATDTKNVKLVFAAIKDTILQNSLKVSGIY